ncbi:unnamed protein product [Allacma fusca]|uniref:Arrestin C-terminal-like domain-containing protein n=1 Tax=Allacma fusca TaxID=39272 RepID=A0A8J2LAB9_9HEXA|nr:unnamed protein product [Allacma fusca]
MGLDQFTIEFDNPTKSYFPGQNVTGKVVVVCSSSKNVQGLRIKFEGKASVHWTEEEKETVGSGNDREERTTTRVYEDSDTFFDYKFFAAGDDRNDVTIPAGRNEYPFQFALPQGLPSSFIGAYGKVSYEVNAVMKRSWKFDHEVKNQFTVNALADLNNDAGAAQPGELKKTKNLCCLCCASGPIGYVFKISRKGYVPGEFVQIECELQNNSSRNVTGVTLAFVQTSTYYAKGKSKVATKNLSEVKRPGVEPGDTDIWRGDILQIPSVPPTKLGNCHLIDVQYQLNLEMAISGPALNLKGSLPIIVGTIPFRNNFLELMPQNNGTFAPSAPPVAAYPDMPPPNYKDAMYFGPDKPQQTIVDDITNKVIDQIVPKGEEYIPKYVTYGWNLPPPSGQ